MRYTLGDNIYGTRLLLIEVSEHLNIDLGGMQLAIGKMVLIWFLIVLVVKIHANARSQLSTGTYRF